MPHLLVVLIVLVVLVGALPIVGFFVWRTRRLVESALADAHAGGRHVSPRVVTLVIIYGTVATILLIAGLVSAFRGPPVVTVVGVAMMTAAFAYAWALCTAVAHSRRPAVIPGNE